MLNVEFPYKLEDGHDWVIVKASCKIIKFGECEDIEFKFLDAQTSEIIMDVTYDRLVFEDIENEAEIELLDAYYNRDVYTHITRH